MSAPCSHAIAATFDRPNPSGNGCVECLATGGTWVHLRICMTCGHVGCCNDSPSRHAAAHAAASRHPLIRSFEPGEDWWYCYADDAAFNVDGSPPAPSYHL